MVRRPWRSTSLARLILLDPRGDLPADEPYMARTILAILPPPVQATVEGPRTAQLSGIAQPGTRNGAIALVDPSTLEPLTAFRAGDHDGRPLVVSPAPLSGWRALKVYASRYAPVNSLCILCAPPHTIPGNFPQGRL